METRPWHRHYDYNVPTSLRYPHIPAHFLAQVAIGIYPDKAALNFYGTEMTFWEVRTRMMQLASALGGLGVTKGERVGLHLPNCPQFVLSYLAVLSLGAIVVHLNPLYTVDELTHIVKTTGMTTLITFDMVLPVVRPLVADARIPRVIVTKVTDYINGFGVSTGKDLELEEGWHHFSALIDGVPLRDKITDSGAPD